MASLDSTQEAAAAERAAAVHARWGHPRERRDILIARVQDHAIRQWSDVQVEWLAMMWCLDQYRIADAPPSGMGKAQLPYRSRLDGIYRGKGNWFSEVLTLLLNNRTGQTLRSRSKIRGLSQNHQIDLAWPDRETAPVVCAESKLSGGPAYLDFRGRGAMDDWTNRRRELKFSATDLKLWRRDQSEKIGHWDVWRHSAMPKTFMLWAALLSETDSVEKMVRETSAVVSSYLDGAGIFAFRRLVDGDGYVPVELPLTPGVETIDTALYRIESEIERALSTGAHLQPAAPTDPILNTDRLFDDA
jgi:hypothetical protein